MRPIIGVNEDPERYQFRVFELDGGPQIAKRPGPPLCRQPFRPALLPAAGNACLAVSPVISRYHIASIAWSRAAAGEMARTNAAEPGVRGWRTTVSVEMHHDS